MDNQKTGPNRGAEIRGEFSLACHRVPSPYLGFLSVFDTQKILTSTAPKAALKTTCVQFPRNRRWRGAFLSERLVCRSQAKLQIRDCDQERTIHWRIEKRYHRRRGCLQPTTPEYHYFGKAEKKKGAGGAVYVIHGVPTIQEVNFAICNVE